MLRPRVSRTISATLFIQRPGNLAARGAVLYKAPKHLPNDPDFFFRCWGQSNAIVLQVLLLAGLQHALGPPTAINQNAAKTKSRVAALVETLLHRDRLRLEDF